MLGALFGHAAAGWPLAAFARAAAAAPRLLPAIEATQRAVPSGSTRTTNASGAFAAQPGVHTLDLRSFGDYLGLLPQLVGYHAIVLTRSDLHNSVGGAGALVALLRRAGYRTRAQNAFALVLVPGPAGLRRPHLAIGNWATARVRWRQSGIGASAVLHAPSGLVEIAVRTGQGGHGTVCVNQGAAYVCESEQVLGAVSAHRLVFRSAGTALLLSVYVDAGTPLPHVLSRSVRYRSIRYVWPTKLR